MITAIIPHMPSIEGADEALDECVKSLVGYDELIVVVNEGMGFGPAVNQGLRLAHGDFLAVINNDTTMRGTLRDMADPNFVTVPRIHGQPDKKPRCFYMMPRWVYDEGGGYDEQFKIGYFEDDDLLKRWELGGVSWRQVPEVVVFHKDGGGMTIKKVGQDGTQSAGAERENFEANEARFKAKWQTK